MMSMRKPFLAMLKVGHLIHLEVMRNMMVVQLMRDRETSE